MRTQLTIVFMAAALLAGCGGATKPDPAGQAPNGTYEIVDITGASQPATTGVDSAHIKLTFGPATLTAATGCNTLTGRTRLDGERLTVTELVTTDLPCAEPFVAIQQWLVAFLESQPTVTFDEKMMTLATPSTTIRLRPTAPAAPGTAPHSGQPQTVPRTA
jgi:heat shock protein HslJ